MDEFELTIKRTTRPQSRKQQRQGKAKDSEGKALWWLKLLTAILALLAAAVGLWAALSRAGVADH